MAAVAAGSRAVFPFRPARAALGIVGVLVLLAVMFFFGIDPRTILDHGNGGGGISLPPARRRAKPPSTPAPRSRTRKKFAAVVLKTTEDVWTQEFQRSGKTYTPPNLVLFRGDINSRCGMGVAQMGPFYCPLDHKVYIDLSFYDDLKNRLNAPGDFAQAYVIAHEVGHHVQTLLGITDKVMAARAQAGEVQSNAHPGARWSFRRTVLPGSGPTTRRSICSSSSRAISRRR